MGIDEKYGPICISLIRESIEKMAVLGHTKDWAKCRVAKYQYRMILRTTDVSVYFIIFCDLFVFGNPCFY